MQVVSRRKLFFSPPIFVLEWLPYSPARVQRCRMYATAEMLRSVVPEDRVYGRERQLEKIEPLPPITVASTSSGRHVPAMGCKSNPKTWLSSVSFPPTAAAEKYNSMRGPSCGRS